LSPKSKTTEKIHPAWHPECYENREPAKILHIFMAGMAKALAARNLWKTLAASVVYFTLGEE